MRGLARRREAPLGREERAGPPPRATGARVAGASFAVLLVIARLVMTVAALIALLIALAIVLRDVDANAHNSIVKGIHEGANFFAGAFTGMITFHHHPKLALTVNWGIALLVYLVAGSVVAGVIARPARRAAY
jgi:hypothetical protein